MAAFDYASLRLDTVDPLLAEFGGEIHVGGVPTTAVRYDYTNDEFAAGNLISGDVKFIVSGSVPTPVPLVTEIRKGGIRWQVLRTEDIAPADTSVAKILHCRYLRG